MKESTKKTLMFMGSVVLSVWVAQIVWQAFRLDRIGNWVSTSVGKLNIPGTTNAA